MIPQIFSLAVSLPCSTRGVEFSNVVITEGGHFVEVLGSGEESTFSQAELNTVLSLVHSGIEELVAKHRAVIG